MDIGEIAVVLTIMMFSGAIGIVLFLATKAIIHSRRESPKEWGDYKELGYCPECGYLEKTPAFHRVCPVCGGRKMKEVVARWLISDKQEGFINRTIYHENEIRRDD